MPSRDTQSAPPSGRSSHAPKCVPVWLAAIALVPFAACDTPGVTLVDPDISNPSDKGTTIHVTLEDSALAEALGWSQGVPNAEVQLHRVVEAFQPDVVFTDSAGNAYVSNLLPGFYRIAVQKSIAGSLVGGVERVFGDGLKQQLANRVNLAMRIDEAGSLVISEFFFGGGTPEIQYPWDAFWELYNNSDTTIYLDGMLLGYAFGHMGSALHTCAEQQPYREDPLGLVSREFHQFPGAGQDHPVAPGQAVVIALDAVDHSEVHPTLPDLSHADFELEGVADTDNPDVPNMPSVGPGVHPYGHGMITSESSVKFVALPADPASLAVVIYEAYDFSRIPAELVLDVQHAGLMDPNSAPHPILVHFCHRWVNREFDRLEAASYSLGDNDYTTSLHRRILRHTPDGRAVLQDLNVSYFDFVAGRYSPGRIEY
ncbi:MAG: hypothetical protein JSW51_00190 [Gemmatimonadota bacterium]|nr:MAG: hypothetical protein JSW51_00190 [Gemmatimonadota bacterium]